MVALGIRYDPPIWCSAVQILAITFLWFCPVSISCVSNWNKPGYHKTSYLWGFYIPSILTTEQFYDNSNHSHAVR